MRYCWIGCLLFGGMLFAGSPEADSNVNTRYKVETVIVSGSGWSTDIAADQDHKVSPSLRKRISTLIGDQLNPSALEDITKRLSKEFHTNKIEHHVLRGASPDYVKVVFEVGERNERFDVAVSRFIYDAKQGWSGAAYSSATVKHNSFTFGMVSDNNELPGRYAGIVTRYENSKVGSDNVHLEFEFDSFHEQWNRNTLEQAPANADVTSAAYRTRQNFEPALAIMIVEPLTVTIGASFERFQQQYPAPHTEAANAVVSTVRYHRQLEGSETGQDWAASYSLRAATRVLGTDYVYARQRWDARYTLTHGRHSLSDDVSAGMISGRAPLFERCVLGNADTLRGWNRFDLDPVGGNRMIHNSVEYRYRVFEAFYDAGAVWDSGQPATPRHGAGVGIHDGAFALAVAFPIRSGRAEPIFMMGMNY